ncbi:MAG: membrane protein insertion efficiency factor YidD [Acidimicrobiales bacterium]
MTALSGRRVVRASLPTRALLGLVGLYQAARSGRRSPCRYDPSCSAYAATALERFGAGRGAWLAARRLARCHPWGGFGPDPVPASSPRPHAPPHRPPS